MNPALKARLQFARDTYGSVNDMKDLGVTATNLRTMTGQTDLLNNPINKNKPNIKSNPNNPVNNPINNPNNNPTSNPSNQQSVNNPTNNVERSGHMNTMRQRYDRSMARRQRVDANNQNKDVFQQPLNNYIDPNTQAPKPPIVSTEQTQGQNSGSKYSMGGIRLSAKKDKSGNDLGTFVNGEKLQTAKDIDITNHKGTATEITSVANNSADAAKTPAVKKMEEQQQQQQPPVEPVKPTEPEKPVEPVKPAEPVKPVETPPAGGGAGDTSGAEAATSQTTTDTAATTTGTTNTTNTNTTNTNEEKKKGMGIGGKIALGTAATIGIGAMGYAMGSGNNKDDDKRR